MKVIHQNKKVVEYTFEDLDIGDVFLDAQGDLGVKTRENEYIYTIDESRTWCTCAIDNVEMVVKPLEATLVIEGEFI